MSKDQQSAYMHPCHLSFNVYVYQKQIVNPYNFPLFSNIASAFLCCPDHQFIHAFESYSSAEVTHEVSAMAHTI